MIANDNISVINRWPYQFRVSDETPSDKSPYHRYSVIRFKKNVTKGAYVLKDGDRDIFAESAEKAVKIYLIKIKKSK